MTILLGMMLAAGTSATAATPPAVAPAPSPAIVRPAALPRPTRAQVLAAVSREFPRYDSGAKGRLTPLEFSTWVMRSHGGTVAPRARARGIAPVSAMNASATAFSRADANHDGGVTPDEMASFLMLPPTPTALTRAKTAAAKPSVPPLAAAPAAAVAGR
jgi:hypothetical protein